MSSAGVLESSLIRGVPTPLSTSIEALLDIVLADVGLLSPEPDLEDPGLELGSRVAVSGLKEFDDDALDSYFEDFVDDGLEF